MDRAKSISNAIFLLLLFCCAGLAQQNPPATGSTNPASELGLLVKTTKEDLQPRLREGISQPGNASNTEVVDATKEVIEKFRRLPQPPELNWVSSASRYRMIAFLEVMLARLEGERIAYQSGPPGIDPNRDVLGYANAALSDIATAKKHVESALQPDSKIAPELLQWMKEKEDIPGQLLHIEAHAHAIIWSVTKRESERAAARTAWNAASITPFGKKNTQPSPELAIALDLYRPGQYNPHLVTTLLWIGVGLIGLGVIIAIFVPNPTSFQMFIFRILAALGAAGVGASLPGFIGFKSASVTAGGAVALLVLIYLVNPPRLARNLAGN